MCTISVLHITYYTAVTALRTSTKLPTSGLVSTEMGDHVRVQFLVRYIYLGM